MNLIKDIDNLNILCYYIHIKGTVMAKVKILKSLPKSKKKHAKPSNFKRIVEKPDKFKDNYLNYYDDIKISSRRYDW